VAKSWRTQESRPRHPDMWSAETAGYTPSADTWTRSKALCPTTQDEPVYTSGAVGEHCEEEHPVPVLEVASEASGFQER